VVAEGSEDGRHRKKLRRDPTLLLAARLARAAGRVHPSDWIKVYESHTPYEWMVQVCLARIVDPWGDDRADWRAAINTVNSIPLSEDDDPQKIFSGLRNYITPDEENSLYDEDALAAVKDAQCPM
jgi:hypothetical protein